MLNRPYFQKVVRNPLGMDQYLIGKDLRIPFDTYRVLQGDGPTGARLTSSLVRRLCKFDVSMMTGLRRRNSHTTVRKHHARLHFCRYQDRQATQHQCEQCNLSCPSVPFRYENTSSSDLVIVSLGDPKSLRPTTTIHFDSLRPFSYTRWFLTPFFC